MKSFLVGLVCWLSVESWSAVWYSQSCLAEVTICGGVTIFRISHCLCRGLLLYRGAEAAPELSSWSFLWSRNGASLGRCWCLRYCSLGSPSNVLGAKCIGNAMLIVKNDCLFVRGCWVFVGFVGGVLYCGFVRVHFVFFFRALVLVCVFCCLFWVFMFGCFCFVFYFSIN